MFTFFNYLNYFWNFETIGDNELITVSSYVGSMPASIFEDNPPNIAWIPFLNGLA
ncbi:hypothetical protein [Mycoplasmopsis maculosa]|uniref:hypothetical protein n=1 Tax=Mycoplasmopsis maculosa TaxID=114885 RepID=UPI001CB77545|nr:hypothetical protein [Mycoplasmopsis maculosa]